MTITFGTHEMPGKDLETGGGSDGISFRGATASAWLLLDLLYVGPFDKCSRYRRHCLPESMGTEMHEANPASYWRDVLNLDKVRCFPCSFFASLSGVVISLAKKAPSLAGELPSSGVCA